jgi:uncharacterized protein (TIGR02145 family)
MDYSADAGIFIPDYHGGEVFVNLRQMLIRVTVFIFFIFEISYLKAQNSDEMPFRFWLRNQRSAQLVNRNIVVKISLVSEKGDQSYFSENQELRTNSDGMISLLPGEGFAEARIMAHSLASSVFLKMDADTSGKDNFDYSLLFMPLPSVNDQKTQRNEVRISATGDTLFLQSGQYRIFPGLSSAKPRKRGWKGTDCHTCGAKEIHNPELEYGMVKDYDGNEYKTIAIGSQVWMAENLKSAHFQNGDPIPHLKKRWEWLQTGSPAFCWYKKDSAKYESPYGKLYNWYAAADPRNVCPAGWHVPTPFDWNLLQNYLGGKGIADEKMKVKGRLYFRKNGLNANNSSGFSAIPTGYRLPNGYYKGIEKCAHFWTTSGLDSEFSNAYSLFSLEVIVFQETFFSDPVFAIPSGSNSLHKNLGIGIRCLKD